MQLIYDLKSIPKDMSIEEFLKFINDKKIVFWDSSLNGQTPIIQEDLGLVTKDVFKDLTSKTC